MSTFEQLLRPALRRACCITCDTFSMRCVIQRGTLMLHGARQTRLRVADNAATKSALSLDSPSDAPIF